MRIEDSGTKETEADVGRCGRRLGLGGLGGVEPRHLRAQPGVVVAKLPVGLGERIQLPGQAPADASADTATSRARTATTRAPQPTYLTGSVSTAVSIGSGRQPLLQSSSEPMAATSKTILICDDDQGMRDTIAAILAGTTAS